jgi:hypothetical protein
LVTGTGPFRVMFAVVASELNLGDAEIDVKVTATPDSPQTGGGGDDAIRVSIPVLPRQHAIMAGTSMALGMQPEPFIWPEGK